VGILLIWRNVTGSFGRDTSNKPAKLALTNLFVILLAQNKPCLFKFAIVELFLAVAVIATERKLAFRRVCVRTYSEAQLKS